MATTTTKTDTTDEAPTDDLVTEQPVPAPAGPVVGSLVLDQYHRRGIVTELDAEGVPSVAWLPEAVPCYTTLAILV